MKTIVIILCVLVCVLVINALFNLNRFKYLNDALVMVLDKTKELQKKLDNTYDRVNERLANLENTGTILVKLEDETPNGKSKYGQDTYDLIKSMLDKGMSAHQISLETGIPYSTTKRLVNKVK